MLGNIRKINEHKRKQRSGFPYLKWQFIVFGHNEHEIAAARKLAGELGMGFYAKLSWDDGVSPIRNRELVQIQTRTKELTRAEFYQATGKDYMRGICHQLWRAPVLNWDGRVTGCCANAFQDGLTESLNNEGIQHARQMLMGRAPERAGLPCTTCDLYQVMKNDGRWLTEEEIWPKRWNPNSLLLSIVPEPASVEVTHVDILTAAGARVNRQILANPPHAARFTVGSSFSISSEVPAAGGYTVYAFPKRLDPAFRKQYPPMAPTALVIRVEPRPTAQEFRISV